jgi:glycosyltransferase involved in cell wall biosynthesis
MNRAVLIVTPFFAPQNHAAVFRAYKLAKYLPQFGWKPIILTGDRQYEFNEDPCLLAELPGQVEIVRARYVEPTLRGVRMAFGGRDRSFKSLKQVTGNRNSRRDTRPSAATRTYNHLIKSWVQVPDAYWTWANAAVVLGKKIIRERGISVIYTSCSPYSSLCVGSELQREGVKWVADFRDPLGYSQKLANYAPHMYRRQRAIVKNALSNADAVTVLSSSYSSIFKDVFGNEHRDPIFIPTGIDQDLLQPCSEDTPQLAPYLIFAGEYLPEYDNTFVETFSIVLQNPEIATTGIKLLVVGTLSVNRSRLMPAVERFGISRNVEFQDQIPQSEVYKLVRAARAGVLIPGTRAFWWANFAKMTDYIGMRKPVVAVVPDPSEARTALTRSRLGIFLDGSTEQRVHLLKDFLLGKHKMAAPDEDECDRYTAQRQVQSFVEIFESLSQPRIMSASAQ